MPAYLLRRAGLTPVGKVRLRPQFRRFQVSCNRATTVQESRCKEAELRFFLFLVVLAILTVAVLYFMGSNRAPEQRIIEQEISLETS
jgi:hypothetical protein